MPPKYSLNIGFGDRIWPELLLVRVGDEYGEKSKLFEKDRNGDNRDLADDPFGEPVCNLPSLKDAGDLAEILGSTRLLWMRVLGTTSQAIREETCFSFVSRAFKDKRTFSSGNGAKPKNRRLWAENVCLEYDLVFEPSLVGFTVSWTCHPKGFLPENDILNGLSMLHHFAI